MDYKTQLQKEKEADKMIITMRSVIIRASTIRLLELIQITNRELIERKLRGYSK